MRTVPLLVLTNVVSLLGTASLVNFLGRRLVAAPPGVNEEDEDDANSSLPHKMPLVSHTLRNLQTTCCVCNGGEGRDLPSSAPSTIPSVPPSLVPSMSLSRSPSLSPSGAPSPLSVPSVLPSFVPSTPPSLTPSGAPSPLSVPAVLPSFVPSLSLSTSPSLSPSEPPSATPSLSPSLSPSHSLSPTSSPSAPTLYPSAAPTTTIPFAVVLASDTKLTHTSPGVSSPNGLYFFRMGGSDFDDDLLLVRRQLNQGDAVIWRIDSGIPGVNGTTTLYMQSGGNLVLRAANRTTLWKTNTGKSSGAYLILDDDGQMAIVLDEDDGNGGTVMTRLWFDGRPKGFYPDTPIPDKQNLELPVRGAFYYPWFPETWTIQQQPTKYNATLGKYSSGRAATYENHLDALSYARIDLVIASWFGPNSNLDRARIHNLLQRSPPNLKWTVYHEDELGIDPNAIEIRADLDYLKYWFAFHESWAHIDGRPVIFVYNEPNDCGVSERWMTASQGEWYVVLKLFRGFTDCPVQPDSWHQYGPAAAINYNQGYSMSISPGFWRADQEEPLLARLSEDEWRGNVAKMVDRNEQWQLVTTFNEWGEGTSVESGTDWESDSGYGFYLDALHEIY